jgi:Transposase DDE domain group 1
LRVQATNSTSSFDVTTDGVGVVGHAGAVLLQELADRLGLTRALGWHGPQGRRRHPDAAVLRDLAVMLADGGDCLSDLAALRDQPQLFGPVASTPTAWRVIERAAQDPDGLARLRAARAHARARAWTAGAHPKPELLVIDTDATLVLAHSDNKEGAAGTYKGSFGFAPLLAYLDRGAAPGEPLAGILRPGNAPAGATDDLVELVDLALAQLPATSHTQPVLVRSDSAGGSSKLAWHLRQRGIEFSLGMQIDAHVREAILTQPEPVWTSAVDPGGQLRDGAEVCELTGWIDLGNWPVGTRMLCRREDAHPGAQLRFTDHDGHRFQAFATDQPDGDLAALELRHRQRAASRTASAPPRPPAFRTSRLTSCAATPSGSSWSLPPKTLSAGHSAAAGRRTGRGRTQDPALPAVACGRSDRPPRPPAHPATAAHLAVGRRTRPSVRPAASPAAALLSRHQPAPTTRPPPPGVMPRCRLRRPPPPRPGAASTNTTPTSQRTSPRRRQHDPTAATATATTSS